MVRKIIGLLLLIAAVAGIGYGIYLDITYFLVGGIVQIIDGIKATPTDAHMIAWGVVKILFAGLGAAIGSFVGFFLGGSGLFLMGAKKSRPRGRFAR